MDAAAAHADKPPVRRRNKRASTKVRLLTRAVLDGRRSEAKLHDRLLAEILADLGGADQCGALKRALAEAFVGSYLNLGHLHAQQQLGEKIDINEHATTVSSMVRLATRLGIERQPKDITPDPLEYAKSYDARREQASTP